MPFILKIDINTQDVDAPYHFLENGKTIDRLSLDALVGNCYVAEEEGCLTKETAKEIMARALSFGPETARRILLKGKVVVTEEAAAVFKDSGVLLIGNESQTVGPEEAPAGVHHILLGADVILLEGIRLEKVEEGEYLLNAAPLNLGGADGAPCRAILMKAD